MAMDDTLHELSLTWYGGPLAFILEHKNYFKVRRIDRMKDFFINKMGLFQVDSETEYRYGKQPISFYNSHDTHIPNDVVKRVQKLYHKRKYMEVRKELELIYPEIKGENFKDIYECFQYIVDMTEHNAIDIDTEKFMPKYRAYNPISIKRLMERCHIARKAVEDLNPSFPKPPLPLTIAIIVGLLGFALIQNAQKWVREGRDWIDDTFAPAPVEVVEPVVEVAEEVAEEAVIVVNPANLILWIQSFL